jgi:uncharacterized protein YyaL (SSP411 family)
MKRGDCMQGSNHLAGEKSPYLLQHAENPVDWYPWSEEAFLRAKEEEKPIFLSIGYSTCHWCHVMAHESFEDGEVARLLNATFICIKVDREERPDIDQVYMTIAQAMTGRGGWPLSIFMTPGKKPFFAATYIPKESRSGVAGFLDIIPRIQEIWEKRRDAIESSAEVVLDTILKSAGRGEAGTLDLHLLELGYRELLRIYDGEFGGFGSAPKFPTPHTISFLLRVWNRLHLQKALEMATRTLEAMRLGGIYDQIGFGFHRYSTDREWVFPHFEKMLYDQALLAIAYTEAFQVTRDPLFRRTAEEILRYVLRDMAGDWGFYTAEDADSEGIEGKFYLWTAEELQSALNPEDASYAMELYHVQHSGNFTDEATGMRSGRNILYVRDRVRFSGRDDDHEPIRDSLFRARSRRIRPHRDDKVLTDWNGLFIVALARGYRVFGRDEYREAAQQAVTGIFEHLRSPDGRLLHRFRDGDAVIPGHLDDYSFLIWGLLELYEATFDPALLANALDLNRVMVEHFWDDSGNGFFFTADDGESLVLRTKEVYDGAVPSGNSVALLTMHRLARITGDAALERRAIALAEAFAERVSRSPAAHTFFLSAIDFALGPGYDVVVAGRRGDPATEQMISALQRSFLPKTIILFRPEGDEAAEDLAQVAPFTREMGMMDGRATAYVCRDRTCEVPTTDSGQLLSLLGVKQAAKQQSG